MHPNNEDKTAFITIERVYCYQIMSFSLKNAEATYQRMMNKVFTKQISRNIEVYVNDISIKSKDLK